MHLNRTAWGALATGIALPLLAGCGWPLGRPTAASVTPSPKPARHAVWRPEIKWYPIAVGAPVLLAEGAQVSSLLQGPRGRIYYGTTNPLGNANVIGWFNPRTLNNRWLTIPTINPLFPANAGLQDLGANQAASWGGVSLVVSGTHNVWYRSWGYVGAWSATTGQFVKGSYGVPGPTVTNGDWTASVSTTFQGISTVTLMNLQTRQALHISVPSTSTPVALALTRSAVDTPIVWMATNQSLLKLLPGRTAWTPVALLPTDDFFVSLGQWGQTIWTVDANGNIARIRDNALVPVATVPIAPLNAVTAPHGGLWIISPHRIALWEPRDPVKTWKEPVTHYTAPASTWARTGTNEPPNWPPMSHLASGSGNSALVGQGSWIGVATLVKQEVTETERRKIK